MGFNDHSFDVTPFNLINWSDVQRLKDDFKKFIVEFNTLRAKVDYLTKSTTLGNSLQLINDQHEVVQLKSIDGKLDITYSGLKKIFDIYNDKLKAMQTYIEKLEKKITEYKCTCLNNSQNQNRQRQS